MWRRCGAAAGLFLVIAAFSAIGHAEAPRETIVVDDSGIVHMPPIDIPLSTFLSPEARQGTARYFRFLQSPAVQIFSLQPSLATIAEHRRKFAVHFAPVRERVNALYPADSVASTIDGVAVDVITPKNQIASRNTRRVLINLHGGGFVAGGRIMGALESIPVASLGRIKVLAVDYRQGPEYKYPAGTEDVVAVYRELLKQYKPGNIGIYGCSAGGFLTAQVTAWIANERLPAPGAIGIFCASAGGWTGGDSDYLAAPLIGMRAGDPKLLRHPTVSDVAYFSDANFNDPLVAPILSTALLAKFPPTLLLTSGRDSAMSSAVHTHAQLVKAGVDARLHVWEGLPHGFFTFEPDFPESREAWDVVVRFFDRHLGVD